jgi:hypothetical protein
MGGIQYNYPVPPGIETIYLYSSIVLFPCLNKETSSSEFY